MPRRSSPAQVRRRGPAYQHSFHSSRSPPSIWEDGGHPPRARMQHHQHPQPVACAGPVPSVQPRCDCRLFVAHPPTRPSPPPVSPELPQPARTPVSGARIVGAGSDPQCPSCRPAVLAAGPRSPQCVPPPRAGWPLPSPGRAGPLAHTTLDATFSTGPPFDLRDSHHARPFF